MSVAPQNLEAEESVLGAILLNPNVITNVADIVQPGDFYRSTHGIIYKTALDLDAKGIAVDAITLADALPDHAVKIHELAALVPSAGNAPHYARIVREQAGRRALARAGQRIASLAADPPGDIDELYAEAEKALSEATTRTYDSEFSPASEGLDEFYEQIKNAVETGTPITGLRTGFYDLDKMTAGFFPGNLIVVAARPRIGKSVLAQNISENVCDHGGAAAFFTLEMSRKEMQIRSLARATRVAPLEIRTGKLSSDELAKVRLALPTLKSRRLYVEDQPTITPTELRARARRLQRKHGLDLLVVDYIQLMIPGEAKSRDNRQQEVANISRSLKLLAKELEIPVIAISQLNRALEGRDDKRPTLADLRDSGAIEQDADLVLFIYREDTYKPVAAEQAGDAELIIAKNRMGESGTVRLLFLGRRQTFATPAGGAQ